MHLYTNTELYDLVHGKFADDEAFSFYRQMAEQYGPKILDIGCGTGYLLIPMAEHGFDISGFDLSNEMLAECKRKADERNLCLDVWIDDMETFNIGRTFDLIFIAGNSFQHLMTDTAISNALASIKKHLNKNGKLLIELFNPSWPLLMREPEKRLMIGQFGDHILTEDSVYDIENRLSHITWHFWHKPSGNETSLSYSSREYFPEDVRSVFAINGFTIDQHFGEFDMTPFDEQLSSKHLVIASARNE